MGRSLSRPGGFAGEFCHKHLTAPMMSGARRQRQLWLHDGHNRSVIARDTQPRKMASAPDNVVAPAAPPPAEPSPAGPLMAEPLMADPASDRCSRCNAPLAHDQRYCVDCGERRGRPRFGSSAPAALAAAPSRVAAGTSASAPPSPRSPRFSPATTLVAGVATLLLAMGVGVLIGENGASSNSRQAAAGAPQVITVNGGASQSGGASQATSTPTTGASSTKTAKSAGHKRSAAHSGSGSGTHVVHLTKKVTQQIQKGVSNVVGTNAHLASPTTQVGGKCESGQAGCQNGKFTGDFFGSG